MAEENKFSIDMNAEKLLLGNLFNQDEDTQKTVLFSDVEPLPESEKYQFTPVEELPPPEYPTYQTENTESQNLTSLYVESKVTGLNFSVNSSIDDISDKVSQLEDNLGNVSRDLLKAYKTINDTNSNPRPSDPFEERVTVLPTNLIYDDRVQRTIEKPSWA
jgi:hypothetical protein